MRSNGSMYRHSSPICPHCGSRAPHGDSRLVWLNTHLDSRLHRWWWRLKKLKKKGK